MVGDDDDDAFESLSCLCFRRTILLVHRLKAWVFPSVSQGLPGIKSEKEEKRRDGDKLSGAASGRKLQVKGGKRKGGEKCNSM